MLCFGPGYLLGPRVVHAIDFVSMLANVWTPALIVEMMICRTLIVYDTRYSKRTLLMATSIPIIYSFAICVSEEHYSVQINSASQFKLFGYRHNEGKYDG